MDLYLPFLAEAKSPLWRHGRANANAKCQMPTTNIHPFINNTQTFPASFQMEQQQQKAKKKSMPMPPTILPLAPFPICPFAIHLSWQKFGWFWNFFSPLQIWGKKFPSCPRSSLGDLAAWGEANFALFKKGKGGRKETEHGGGTQLGFLRICCLPAFLRSAPDAHAFPRLFFSFFVDFGENWHNWRHFWGVHKFRNLWQILLLAFDSSIKNWMIPFSSSVC